MCTNAGEKTFEMILRLCGIDVPPLGSAPAAGWNASLVDRFAAWWARLRAHATPPWLRASRSMLARFDREEYERTVVHYGFFDVGPSAINTCVYWLGRNRQHSEPSIVRCCTSYAHIFSVDISLLSFHVRPHRLSRSPLLCEDVLILCVNVLVLCKDVLVLCVDVLILCICQCLV